MKKIRYFIGVFFILACFFCSLVFAEAQIPEKPENYVSDYAQLLSIADKDRLNKILGDYEKKTTNQLFVAIFPGKLTDTIEDFSVRLEEKWKVGKKSKDNGILLVIFPEDHQLRIEVGYGLEGAIPDTIANSIIQDVITPSFKEKRYAEGIENGMQAIMKAAAGEYTAAEDSLRNVSNFELFFSNAWLFLLVGFVVLLMSPRYLGLIFSLGFSLFIFGIVLGGVIWIGTFIVYAIIYHIVPAKYRYADRIGFWGGGFKNTRGSDFPFWGGGSSGGSGGSGGGGGTFGGGGGGSSGGGGASGRW
jgi:uncharacterized protein